MSQFAKTLKSLLDKRGITARVLSEAIEVPKSTLSEWTAGREPKLSEQIIRLARFFGVSVEYLITGTHPEEQMAFDLNRALENDFAEIHQGVYRIRIERLQSQKPLRKN